MFERLSVSTRRRGTQLSRVLDGSAPLHILHLGFEDPLMPGAGGGSVRTHEINRRLVARGHQVTVLTTKYPGSAERIQDGVHYQPIGIGQGCSRLSRLCGYVLLLPQAVRRHRDADLAVEDFFAPFSTMAAPRWTHLPTVGMVQWLHARDKAREYRLPFHLVERAGVRQHRQLIAVSQGTADRLGQMNPHALVAVIGNGVDPAAFSTTPRLGQDIVFIGRLELHGKGLDLLLAAWSTACQQIRGQLIIAGSGRDEPQIRKLVQDLNLVDRVRFVGWVQGDAKLELLNSARLVVVPSRHETFGLVAIEALASATPVVAFAIPCLNEVVPRYCGWLVPRFDVNKLSKQLIDSYNDDYALAAAGRRGRAFAGRFNWDNLATAQLAQYRRALELELPTTDACAAGGVLR